MANSIFTISELKENYNAVMRLLSEVQADHIHTQKSIDLLERLPMQSVPGDIAGQAKANAAMEIVKFRESTNQKLIDAYMKMYNDLKTVIFEQEEKEEASDEKN
ncbi:MAG: hypothetical protein K2H01_07945 [Ruminococcus sp.]|nr:hypothetical protein [Ruminococcus sp.]